MRIRAARTLVFSRQYAGLLACNFLTGSVFSCSPDLLTLLASLDNWSDLDDVTNSLAGSGDDPGASIEALIAVNAVTPEHSHLAEAEETYQTNWAWGIPSALFHFSVQDNDYISIDEAESLQRAKLAEGAQPPLHLANAQTFRSILPLPSALEDNDLLQLMAKRRTIREAAPKPVELRQLSDCLFAGLGITGETSNCVGSLPLSMTPSGGARNPYEAYVYARSVSGLAPGFYHYSAMEHSLGRMDADDLPLPSELVGGQDWADSMPCVIILCAFLERTMWKYCDANAYRVVLIEAGHIGQNLMLAATHHGLTACPTAALCHSKIKTCLGLDESFTRAPVYALTLSTPSGDGSAQRGPIDLI